MGIPSRLRNRGQKVPFVLLFTERLLLLYYFLTRSRLCKDRLCGHQETDQEKQRNSNIGGPGPLGVARVRLASEGTRNSEVV